MKLIDKIMKRISKLPAIKNKVATQGLIKQILVETLPSWISVKEKLPEEKDYVLVCLNWYKIRCYPYKKKIICAQFKKGVFLEQMEQMEMEIFTPLITHWMPLPEPPEDK